MKRILILAVALLTSYSADLFANEASSAIYSPNCTQDQIKKFAGDALLSISKNQKWGNNTSGYIVTLETSKMSFGDLAKVMQKNDCFKTD